jgi:hypothetical protein
VIDALGLVQGLVRLPLEEYDYFNLCDAYTMFIKEFTKIEDAVENTTHLFYILKAIIDGARMIRTDYETSDSRKQTIQTFKDAVMEVVTSVTKFCSLKSVHFERMLCGLYAFTDCMSGFYYSSMNKVAKSKMRNYKKLPIDGMADVVNALYYNFQDNYTFTADTIVCVVDAQTKTTHEHRLSPDQLEILENTEYWMVAPKLVDMFKNERLDENPQNNCCMQDKPT